MKYQVLVGEDVKTVNTMKEVCEMLGKRVSKKDITEGLVEGVSIAEEVATEVAEELVPVEVDVKEVVDAVAEEVVNEAPMEEVNEPVVEEVVAEVSEDEPVVEELATTKDATEEDSEEVEEVDSKDPSKMSMEEMMKVMKERNAKAKAEKKAKEKEEEIPFEGEYPEIGTFTSENQLKKFYKNLTDDQLDEWIEIEGWDTELKLSDNASINRMRKCMLIKSKHFPKATGSKKKSKYAKYTTEELLQMALDNDVEVRDSNGDMRILRMYTIMALKEAGILE